MIADVWTVFWKEWKEFLLAPGSLRGNVQHQLLLIFVFAVFLPLETGRTLVNSPLALGYWASVPMMLVNSMVADAFAGERERHTLETLLSTRMPDRPILYGKVLAAVAYGWGATMVSQVFGLIVVNVVHGHGQLLLYPPSVAVAGVVLSLLIAGLAASVGSLVSLRAATVRQAVQTLSIVTLLFWLVPMLGLTLIPTVPATGALAPADVALRAADRAVALVILTAVLAAIDMGLLAAAAARFKRSRLVLD